MLDEGNDIPCGCLDLAHRIQILFDHVQRRLDGGSVTATCCSRDIATN